MNCIVCQLEVDEPFCALHEMETVDSRYRRIDESLTAPYFSGPQQAERALATSRTPTMLRKVVKWMYASGYYHWAKASLKEETYNGLRVRLSSGSTRTNVYITVWFKHPSLVSEINDAGGWLSYEEGGEYVYVVDWNNYGKIRHLIKQLFVIEESTYEVKHWRIRENLASSMPEYIVLVKPNLYSSLIAINRGQLIGGEYVATDSGTTRFANLFKGASPVSGHRKWGLFGSRFVAPATLENLETLIESAKQPLDVKIEAAVAMMTLIKRQQAIASTFSWRMCTEAYSKEKLHRFVYTEKEHPLFFGQSEKVPVEKLEHWKKYLNRMEPYSQQKIMCEASYHAKYVGWWVDMRVGKTPAGMMLARRMLKEGEAEHVVIVAPAINLYDPWYTELEKQGAFRVCVLDEGSVIAEEDIKSEAYDIYLISYSSLQARLPMMFHYWSMESVGWIMDETSLIKNPKSSRAKACIAATVHAPFVYGLNGTPLAQGPHDIWSQQMAIDQGVTFGTSYRRFVDYWLTKISPTKWKLDPEVATLFEMMLSASSIRYIRSEADQFRGRDKNMRYIIMPSTKQMKRSTKEILEGFTRDEDERERDIKSCILTVYGHLREACAAYDKYEVVEDSGIYKRIRHEINPKITWLRTFLKGNPGQPVVIFSEFSESEDMVMEMLDREGISYSSVRQAGSKTPLTGQKRREQLRQFQDGETRVFLLKSVQGKGITLNRIEAVAQGLGSYPCIIYMQPSWSLIDHEQSQDRCVGTDPKTLKSISTMIYMLIIQGSIEEHVVKALRGKKGVAETLLADAARDGYENPFDNMDLSSSDFEGDEYFDAEEQEARYLLGLAPQKKLTRRKIERADVRYKATKFGTTQKEQIGKPPSAPAMYLFGKFEGDLPDANLLEYKEQKHETS